MKIGDKVCYKKSFLQSIGEITGDLPFLRGEVVELLKFGEDRYLATVKWAGRVGDVPHRILTANLSIVDPKRGIADE